MAKNSISVCSPNNNWMHESDAHTLAEAAAIQSDPKRHGNAKKAAIKLAAEKMRLAKSMQTVAKKPVKIVKSTSRKK